MSRKTIDLSYSNEKWSNMCPQNAPLPDCGGIGIAFVAEKIKENERQRDVENLPYGLNLIAAIIKQAISDYEEALFIWFTKHNALGDIGEPYLFLKEWAEVLNVDFSWVEDIIKEEVFKRIERKEMYRNAYRKTL